MLLGLKYMLSSWGYKRNVMDVDSKFTSLTCESREILTVDVKDGNLICNWDVSRQTWQELQNSDEMQQLMSRAADQLKKGSVGGKGFAKGGPE